MRQNCHIRFFLLAILIVFCLAARAVADGCYFPEQAYAAMPQIPVQRAMVVYKGGVETLIVESTFQTPSRNVGWIIPVPAEPTKLGLEDRGLLTSMAMSMRPRITHDLSRSVHALWVILFALLPLAANTVLEKDRKRRRRRFWELGCLYLIGFLLWSVLLPSLGREAPATGTVQVGSSQRLGDYQVSVLRANDADTLSKWLMDSGLAGLSAAARPVVDDYIKRGWCFVVARIRQDATGPATPCPIAVTFAAAAPVFPMKLTALAETTTRVELLVVAEQQAVARGFHCAAADQFHRQRGEVYQWMQMADYFAANATQLNIGDPDAAPWMWNNCWVTKLTADLPPAQMTDDVKIDLQQRAAYRDHFFSAGARVAIIQIILIIGAMILLVLGAYVYQGQRCPSRRQLMVLGSWVALVILGVGVTFLTLPVIDVVANKHWRIYDVYDMISNARYLVDQGQLTARLDNQQIEGFIHDLGSGYSGDINPYTGKRVCQERTPGNFSSRTIDGKKYFCVYDVDGKEFRVELPNDKPAPDSRPTP